MAVDLSKLVSKRKIGLGELNNKVVAIDAFNVLYQFLSIIRQPDGTPLTDSRGDVTSHLSGLFYRTTELIENGILPVYVFDGIPSILKQKTIEARMKRREEQRKAWEEAMAKGELEEARIRAQGSTSVNKQIISSAKELLRLMGILTINAPSEGEAQASYMCRNGVAYAVGSQDYDTMLFGAPRVVRNLTFSGKRKLPKKNVYISVEPEMMDFDDTLKSLGINHRQLIWIGLLLGTDFNDGIKGVGPKTAIKIVKTCNSLEDLVHKVKADYGAEFEVDAREIENIFLHPEVKDIEEREIKEAPRSSVDKDGIVHFMCDVHGFSHERIMKFADRLIERKGEAKQRGIDSWF